MATSLFDSTTDADVRQDQAVGDEAYRAISGVSVAAAALALMSPLAFLDWWLAVVPLVGAVLGGVALRDIARRPTELTGRGLSRGAMVVSAVMLVCGLGYRSYVYAMELPPGFERLNYAMLQPMPGDPPTAVPESATSMNGHNVLLKGYMYPGKQQQGITQFLLVRDQGDCCFGGNPKITDRVLVTLTDAKGIDFSARLRKIAGRFVVRPTGTTVLDGGVLYHLEDASVR
ncbi:MAG: hypothetical protein ACKOEX_11700 [Planctomycetia bacterium]